MIPLAIIDEGDLIHMDIKELRELDVEVCRTQQVCTNLKKFIDDELKVREEGEECDFTDTDK